MEVDGAIQRFRLNSIWIAVDIYVLYARNRNAINILKLCFFFKKCNSPPFVRKLFRRPLQMEFQELVISLYYTMRTYIYIYLYI